MTAFDPSKPVQTRDGRPARIICKDRAGDFPIIALVTGFSGEEVVFATQLNGRFYDGQDHDYDLINFSEVTKKYRRVYEGMRTYFSDIAYSSEQDCRTGARNTVGCYGILEEVYTNGEFTTINFIPWNKD